MAQLDMVRGGLSRRALIKGAAAAGAVAWSAPTIIDSLASPAGAVTGLVGCYKFMYDFPWAASLVACKNEAGGFYDNSNFQNDAANCGQNFNEDHSQQKYTDPNCCKNPPWYARPDIPAGCVTVSPCNDEGGMSITIKVLCDDCWLADSTVLYGNTDSGKCGQINVGGPTNAGSSIWFKQITIDFADDKVPIWVKFWVGCGFSAGTTPVDLPGFTGETTCSYAPAPNYIHPNQSI